MSSSLGETYTGPGGRKHFIPHTAAAQAAANIAALRSDGAAGPVSLPKTYTRVTGIDTKGLTHPVWDVRHIARTSPGFDFLSADSLLKQGTTGKIGFVDGSIKNPMYGDVPLFWEFDPTADPVKYPLIEKPVAPAAGSSWFGFGLGGRRTGRKRSQRRSQRRSQKRSQSRRRQ